MIQRNNKLEFASISTYERKKTGNKSPVMRPTRRDAKCIDNRQ